MSGVHIETVQAKHVYTRMNSPWILEEHKSVYGKLIHYLSGGGMSAFGRNVTQEIVRRRHRCFIIMFAVLALIWLMMFFI